MNKIKIAGALVLLLTVILLLLFSFISSKNKENSINLMFINEQKAFTQEISKSIFYTYRNGNEYSKILDITIKSYLNNAKIRKSEFEQNHQIAILWNIFYTDVQKFRNQQKINTGYNTVITTKLVNRIYHNSVLLIYEFTNLFEKKEQEYQQDIESYKKLQYILFTLLIVVLLYLFTQIHLIILFIQKFTKSSKNIIENSTVQGLKPIKDIEQEALKEATKNYNHLIEKIDSSIKYSNQSIDQTTKLLEDVAKNIEDFMEFLSTMQDNESDELFEKEDAVIDSLESLMRLQKKLKNLQTDLDKLTSSAI